MFDVTEDDRRLKLLNIVDEHTREGVAMEVGRQIKTEDVIAVLARLLGARGAPERTRSDNGPESSHLWCVDGLSERAL